MIDALVMAGGRGERMRASYGRDPKPLVRVMGVELLERNLAMLLRCGMRSIAVSVSTELPALGEWVRGRGAAIARSVGAELTTLEERAALGTIGVASRLRGADSVVVINADNLITMDLLALLAHHRAVGAAFTVATHVQPFRIPFGEVVISQGVLTAYREKPELPVRVSSGTYAMAADAIAALDLDARCDVPALVDRLLARGLTVGAFEHDSPWIDVNDGAALARAESLIAAHPERFERHARAPEVTVVGAVLRDGESVLLERRPPAARAYADLWDTPGGKVDPGETPDEAIARELDEELGARPSLRSVATFDDLDPTSGRVFRHHVYESPVSRAHITAREGQSLRWFSPDELRALDGLSAPARRSLAWCAGRPS